VAKDDERGGYETRKSEYEAKPKIEMIVALLEPRETQNPARYYKALHCKRLIDWIAPAAS
jgi:hypothetical protein